MILSCSGIISLCLNNNKALNKNFPIMYVIEKAIVSYVSRIALCKLML